jgi:putative ABC transport system substrate-binding protein
MRRREFITLLGGAATWPLTARAQRGERMRRIGVFIPSAADDPIALSRVTALSQGLQQLGWTDGRNARIDFRFGAGNGEQYRKIASELIALGPDVVMGHGTLTTRTLQRATRTVPIVFVMITDPVGAGIIESLARPGANATGFTGFEYATSGKYLELLKQIAPRVTRVAVTRDPDNTAGTAQFAAIQAVAPSLGVELRPFELRDSGEIERAVATFARQPNGGLIVTPSALAQIHRELIIKLTAQHRLPAIYPYRFYAAAGGLSSYGPDDVEPYRLAAGYIDRILKGEKPGDLPVQTPTKYETVVNLKAAKALGLEISPSLLAIADEVIE